MSTVAVIGISAQVAGFTLAGARVFPADSAAQARVAWQALPDDVAVVILTKDAADAVGTEHTDRLTVVLPP